MTVGNNGLSTRRSSSSASVGDGREENGQATAKENVISKAGKFRRALPQFLACMAKNLLLFDLGMAIGFPTIVIPVLRGLQSDRNPDETIHMTAEESTWVGSLLFLTEPLGSMSSGWITEQLGRKKSMILVNLPHIIAWSLLYFAHSASMVYVAAALLGLGAGLLGSPVAVYVGEISHPSIRGILLSLSGICKSSGLFVIFVLGSLTTWRMAALYCLAVPLLAICAIFFVPETPHWLLAHGRPKDAIRSLQWLRGWVSPGAVAEEYAELTHYIEHADACDDCRIKAIVVGPNAEKCTHPSTYAQKIRDLFRPKTLRPFGLLMLMFFVVQISGNSAIRPFLVQIFQTFRLPIDANWASVIMALTDILSGMFCIVAIPLLGKRRLFLGALCGVVAACIGIAVNALLSFDLATSTFYRVPVETGVEQLNDNHFALVLFIALAACANIVNCMPWILSSEVFPFRIRGTASGISSAFSYVCIFTATKTYFNVEQSMSIFGAFLFYAMISVLGFIILFCILPETENHSLEEIEYYFSDNKRRWNDRTIRPRPDTIVTEIDTTTSNNVDSKIKAII